MINKNNLYDDMRLEYLEDHPAAKCLYNHKGQLVLAVWPAGDQSVEFLIRETTETQIGGSE